MGSLSNYSPDLNVIPLRGRLSLLWERLNFTSALHYISLHPKAWDVLLKPFQHLSVIEKSPTEYIRRPAIDPDFTATEALTQLEALRLLDVASEHSLRAQTLVDLLFSTRLHISEALRWRFLFTRTYQSTIWPKFLASLTRRISQAEFENHLERVYKMRNRCAHHESLVHRDVQCEERETLAVLASIHEIVTLIDSDAADWIAQFSTVKTSLAHRP